MSLKYRLLFIFTLLCSNLCLAQVVCEAIIPVNVILPDGRLIRHLPPSAFENTEKDVVSIADLREDESPRRILLVIETAKGKRKEVLQAEYELAHSIVQQSRSQDRFGVVSALGKRIEIPFGSDNRAALEGIESLRDGKVHKITTDGLMDSIETSFQWFGAPQFGDAVLIIGSRSSENNFSNDGDRLQKELTRRGIRVFSIVTGPFEGGTFYTGFARFTPTLQFTSSFSPNSNDLASISFNTGGYAMAHPEMDYNLSSFKIEDNIRKSLEREGQNMMLAITRSYQLPVRSTSVKSLPWKLKLNDDLKSDLPEALLLRPRILPGCEKKR